MKFSGCLTYPQKYCVMVRVIVAVMVAVGVGDQKKIIRAKITL